MDFFENQWAPYFIANRVRKIIFYAVIFRIYFTLYIKVFKQPWPGMMRTVYGNHERFQKAYFDRFKGYYCAGDG